MEISRIGMVLHQDSGRWSYQSTTDYDTGMTLTISGSEKAMIAAARRALLFSLTRKKEEDEIRIEYYYFLNGLAEGLSPKQAFGKMGMKSNSYFSRGLRDAFGVGTLYQALFIATARGILVPVAPSGWNPAWLETK